MKKITLLIAIAVVALASCTKTTNNNTTKTTIDTNVTTSLPAFTVNGIHDFTFTNGGAASTEFTITVAYVDSAQETVSLAFSPLPPGITMDTTWIASGIPTYSSNIILYDTTLAGATAGTYTMTLTATGSNTGKKAYPFNIKVIPQPPCTSFIVGKYFDCNSSCAATTYTDSVYADPNVTDKIWFTNIKNMGIKIYGLYSCNTEEITIPTQTVGGITYSGSGEGYYSGTSHTIDIELISGSTECEIEMN